MWITFIATVAEPTAALALLQQSPPLLAVSLVVELLGLGLLCGVCAFFGAWFGRATAISRSASPAAEPAAPPVTPVALASPEVTPGAPPDSHITAVIAAAIAATLEPPYRILEIQAAGQTAGAAVGVTNPWAMEGRFQHFSSHKVR